MPEDNIRGNIGGEAGFVLQDCQGDSVFYFIRKNRQSEFKKIGDILMTKLPKQTNAPFVENNTNLCR